MKPGRWRSECEDKLTPIRSFAKFCDFLQISFRSLSVLRDDDDHEGSRLGCRTTGCSRFLFLKFGCGQVDFVRLQVNIHCPGPDWSSHCLQDLELAGVHSRPQLQACRRGSSRTPDDRRTA